MESEVKFTKSDRTMLTRIHAANGRTTQSGCARDYEWVYAIVTIGRFIGSGWALNGKGIEIQADKANIWKNKNFWLQNSSGL